MTDKKDVLNGKSREEMVHFILKGYLSDLTNTREDFAIKLLKSLADTDKWDDTKVAIEYESKTIF